MYERCKGRRESNKKNEKGHYYNDTVRNRTERKLIQIQHKYQKGINKQQRA